MKTANNAPVYVSIYAEMAEITRKHGYALAVHGSIARDFDLICIPWVDKPSEPDVVIAALISEFALGEVGKPEVRLHGRVVYTLAVYFGDCFLDLSFMPTVEA